MQIEWDLEELMPAWLYQEIGGRYRRRTIAPLRRILVGSATETSIERRRWNND